MRLLDPIPYGNNRFEVQRDLGWGLAERVAVFDSLGEAKDYVLRFNKSEENSTCLIKKVAA